MKEAWLRGALVWRSAVTCLVVGSALFFLGCRTMNRLPAVDVSSEGWRLRQGQAVWTEQTNAFGIAGEIIIAMHPSGQSTVQFTKTPLPFLAAQRTAEAWQFELIPQKKVLSGRGAPPATLLWLWLPAGLAQQPLPENVRFQDLADGAWQIENASTGESIRGFLAP